MTTNTLDAQYGYTNQGTKVHMGFEAFGRSCNQGPRIVEVIATSAEGGNRDEMYAALLGAGVKPSKLCGHCFPIKVRIGYRDAVATARQ